MCALSAGRQRVNVYIIDDLKFNSLKRTISSDGSSYNSYRFLYLPIIHFELFYRVALSELVLNLIQLCEIVC